VIRSSGGGRSPKPELDDGRALERPLTAGRGRDERDALGVRVERNRDVRLHREVRPQLRSRRERRAGVALQQGDAHTRVEPLEARHDRVGNDEARVPMMCVVPVVAVLEPEAREVGADPARGEQVRQVEGVLAGLRDRPPAQVLAGHGPHVLAVAVPAALADVDGAAEALERRVVRGVVAHPLHVADVRPHGAAHLPRARFRDHRRQEALNEHRQGDEEEAGADRERADRSHRAPDDTAVGRGSEVFMST
jgi:hypothetical protein